MADEQDSSPPRALMEIKDLFGLSAPATRLVEAIAQGVGRWVYPSERRRNATADIEVFRNWAKALRKEGVAIGSLELSLEERTGLRLAAQEVRRQQHRESIAVQALAEFREKPEAFEGSDQLLDLEWLDKFWRLAEDVSNADFQSVWGRILARYAASGTRYSARCLLTLSTLSREEAQILERLAPIAVQVVLHGRLQPPSITHRIGDHFYGAGTHPSDVSELKRLQTELDRIVLPFEQDILGPIGIYIESGWAYDPVLSVTDKQAEFSIAGTRFCVTGFTQPLPQSALPREDAVMLGGGVRFSPVGAEIIGLIRTKPNPDFVRVLTQILALYGLELNSV